MSRNLQSGVTLIELMITVVIVALLAAIAYPSYQLQVRQSRRAAAEAFLMDVASRQQQRFVDVRSYAAALSDLGVTTPSDLRSYYTVTVGPPPVGVPMGFTLTATPIGAQAHDSCGALTLNQAGSKAPDSCW
jgi:type IV pilus assembly protein PilE